MDPSAAILVERTLAYAAALLFGALATFLFKVGYLDRMEHVERSGAGASAHLRRLVPGAALALCALAILVQGSRTGSAPVVEGGGTAIAAEVAPVAAIAPPTPAPEVSQPAAVAADTNGDLAKSAIERVLRADAALAKLVQRIPSPPELRSVRGASLVTIGRDLQRLSTWIDAANGAYQEIARRMRAISLDACPSDFRSAYLAHTHAWTRRAEAAATFKATIDELTASAERPVGRPLGDGGAERFWEKLAVSEAAEQDALNAIRDTWLEVGKASLRHGVDAGAGPAR